jgi:hypothetical protein
MQIYSYIEDDVFSIFKNYQKISDLSQSNPYSFFGDRPPEHLPHHAPALGFAVAGHHYKRSGTQQ